MEAKYVLTIIGLLWLIIGNLEKSKFSKFIGLLWLFAGLKDQGLKKTGWTS